MTGKNKFLCTLSVRAPEQDVCCRLLMSSEAVLVEVLTLDIVRKATVSWLCC